MTYAEKVFDTRQDGSAKDGEDERNFHQLSSSVYLCVARICKYSKDRIGMDQVPHDPLHRYT